MDTLAEIVRRWIGAVAQNGALSGAAVNACRKAIDEDAALTAKKIATLEAENAQLRAEVDGMREDAGHLWHALKDLSFDCDGVTQTDAPSLGTYNATFAVIQRLASKYQTLSHYQTRKESDRG